MFNLNGIVMKIRKDIIFFLLKLGGGGKFSLKVKHNIGNENWGANRISFESLAPTSISNLISTPM